MRTTKDKLANRKRKKLRGMLLILLGAIAIFSALLLRVRLSDRAIELACEIESLATDKRALEEENRKLALEIARLKNPERISRIAVEKLGLVRSSDTEVIVLKK